MLADHGTPQASIALQIGALRQVAKILVHSLPLLQAVDTLQEKSSPRYSLQVYASSWSEIELVYYDIPTNKPVYILGAFLVHSSSPIPNAAPASFRDFSPLGCRIVLGKTRSGKAAALALPLVDLHARVKAHLAALSEREGGFPAWRAIPRGFVTALPDVGVVLNEIDEAVRGAEVLAKAESAVGAVEVIEID